MKTGDELSDAPLEGLGGAEPAQLLPSPQVDAEGELAAGAEPVARTQWQLFRRRFFRHKVAVAALILLVLLYVCALFAHQLAPYDLNPKLNIDVLSQARKGPSAKHWLGTDELGRDQLTRIIYGGRISLAIGLTVAIAATVIGTLIGMLAGFFGGWTDQGLSRFTDLVLVIPDLAVLAIAGKELGNGSVPVIILILAALYWTYLARVVRGLVISLKEKEFVEAARASGASSFRIIGRHILPNCVGPITVAATLTVATAIITESTLSFLGFGVQSPTVTWGNMLSQSEGTVGTHLSYLIYAPGLAILLTVLAVNFLGDGLRDAFDPQSKH